MPEVCARYGSSAGNADSAMCSMQAGAHTVPRSMPDIMLGTLGCRRAPEHSQPTAKGEPAVPDKRAAWGKLPVFRLHARPLFRWLKEALGQDLPPDAPDTFVTLNAPQPPSPSKVIRRFTLAHPAFGTGVASAQKALSHLQVTLC